MGDRLFLSWIRRVFGAKARPAAELSPLPTVASWNEATHVAAALSSNDARVMGWLTQAEQDWDAFEHTANSESQHFGDSISEVCGDPTGALLGILVHEGYLGHLDWKFPAQEVLSSFSHVRERVGMARLTDADLATFATVEPLDARQESTLFFPDLAGPLDTFLQRDNMRLLECDEGSDSYLFAIVEPDTFDQFVDATIGWLSFYDASHRHRRG